MPEPKKKTQPIHPGAALTAEEVDEAAPSPKSRAEVTQKGMAMIGDLRTDALHQALKNASISDHTLIALLVLALGARNVSVHGGNQTGSYQRESLASTITEGGVITSDHAILMDTARAMLTSVFSCRDNMSNSGIVARIAGKAIDADSYLATMATEVFLACLSKTAIENIAREEGVRVEPRGKDTRAAVIERFKSGTCVYPGALFQLNDDELHKAKGDRDSHSAVSRGWSDDEDGEGADANELPGRQHQGEGENPGNEAYAAAAD
jgi:ParB family chromosome partitioning protein